MDIFVAVSNLILGFNTMEEENVNTEQVVEQPVAEAPKSRRELWEESVRAKYGADLSEDELYDKVGSDYDSEKSYANNARELRKQLKEASLADPDIAKFMESVAAGQSVSEAAKSIPEDMPDADREAYNEMEAEGQRRADAAVESMQKLSDNLDNSSNVLREYFKENNVSDEEAAELTNAFIGQIATPIAEGQLTKEALEIIAKGLCYDKHKVKWEESGRVAGRNEKIEAERQRFEESTDGLPDGEAASGIQNGKVVENNPDADWIRAINEKNRPHPIFGGR